jgi:predicted transcriptional regulator
VVLVVEEVLEEGLVVEVVLEEVVVGELVGDFDEKIKRSKLRSNVRRIVIPCFCMDVLLIY